MRQLILPSVIGALFLFIFILLVIGFMTMMDSEWFAVLIGMAAVFIVFGILTYAVGQSRLVRGKH